MHRPPLTPVVCVRVRPPSVLRSLFSSQEIGKVAFRAHFPRDYPSTPPTLLLTEELIHPNWKYPARGLQVPHLTKEGWDPDTTIPKVRGRPERREETGNSWSC